MKFKLVVVISLEIVMLAGTTPSKALTMVDPEKEEKLWEIIKANDQKALADLGALEENNKGEPSMLHWAALTGSAPLVDGMVKRIRQRGNTIFGEYITCSLEKPKLLFTVGFVNKVHTVKWSPDGSMLCIGSNDDEATLWDVKGKRLDSIWHGSKVKEVAWNPDGGKIAMRGKGRTSIYDIKKREVIKKILYFDKVESLAWSAQGDKICTGGGDEKTLMWDMLKNKELRLPEHKSVYKIAWGFMDRMLYIESSNVASVWDVEENRERLAVQKNNYSAVWDPDGGKICVVSLENIVQVWDVTECAIAKVIRPHDKVHYLKLSIDKTKLCIVSNNDIEIWDMVALKPLLTIQLEERVCSVHWSPDASKICLVSMTTITLWNIGENKKLAVFPDVYLMSEIIWSPDAHKICTIYKKQNAVVYTVNMYDVIDCKVLPVLESKDYIENAYWSPDSGKICIVFRDMVRIWGIYEQKELGVIKHSCKVRVVEWSPDGSKLCTGSCDRNVHVWHLGGTVIDWAVSAVCSGTETEALEALLALDECANLEGLCSKSLLIGLCQAASKVRRFQSDKYEKLCSVIALIARKPGAPL